ncbi:hypothetical protein JHK85_025661 [Glycine max]|nr:hypothetical protein JHK85_025661 [Glycine max]KAG5012903.1 hypothetical protein JHK86_025164 [Glycine max]
MLKGWLVDKDAEALRCQKQLEEEEEAAQKRQAEILERKRQKKLRQKEQKAREQRHKTEAEIKGNIDSTVKALLLAEASLALSLVEASLDTYNFEAHNPNTFSDSSASPVPSQCADTNEKHQRQAVARQQGLPKSQWTIANGLHTNQNSPVSKLEINQKYGTRCDQKASAIVNGSKVWTRKSKIEIDKVVLKTIQENKPDQIKNQEFLIGSISVNLSNCSQSEGNMVASQKDCMVENVGKQNISRDKPMKTDVAMGGNNRSTVKLWRPVSRLETKDPLPVQSGGIEVDAVHGNGQNLSGPSSLRVSTADGGDIGFAKYFSHTEGKADSGSLLFDIQAAKAFLAQKPPGCEEMRDLKTAAYQSSAVDSCNIVANADKRLPATSRVVKSKPRSKKSEKGTKIKYIPKQKTNT